MQAGTDAATASMRAPQIGRPTKEEAAESLRAIADKAAGQARLRNLDWEVDIVETTRRSERVAWRLSGLFAAMCALLVAAICMMLPLHRVIPYVITVDKVTGDTSVVSTDDVVRNNPMLDKHWIATFVIAHERYNYQLIQEDFLTVRRLAGDVPWAAYSKRYVGDEGMDKVYGENIEEIPRVLSVTINDGNSATVRFEVTRTDRRALTPPTVTRKVATLRYAYGKRIVTESEAIKNPLGFSVPGYKVDAELVSEVQK